MVMIRMKRIINYFKRIKNVAINNNKSSFLMFLDVIIWYIFYGSTLTDYLNYEFYKKSIKERKQYAVVRTQSKFYEKINPSKFKKYFTVKPNFLNNFKDYIGRDYYVPENGLESLDKFLKDNKEFIIKPIDGLGGQDVKKMKSSEIKNSKEFLNKLINERMFLEEVIDQNKQMNLLCPTSVNTIRIMTLANNDKSEIIYAALRVGNGIHEVDNFHKGGMGVSIDLQNGKLKGDAIDKNLNTYKKHPYTNVVFDGFQLPYWEETKKLVLKCALQNQKIKVIGWDVAITDKCPILVEGNRRAGFDLPQVLSKRGRKDLINYVLNKLADK